MKKALIHDWYTVYGGAERCVECFTNIWDDFDHYSLIDDLSAEHREIMLKGKSTKNSFIQKLPWGKTKYRQYLPLFPLAIEQFDLSDYELILSSSSCVAKGVLTRPDQLHISYVYSPVRYAWDLYHQYLKESKLEKGLKGLIAKYFLYKLRLWDYSTANRPDYYIAISQYVANRIKKIYNKDSIVIYPPVDTDLYTLTTERDDYFITSSRMVPYKKMDLIVEAFSESGRKLIVIGDGPDFQKIKKLAKPNVILKGYVGRDEMLKLTQKARAFIFAAEEDFGIAPIEAQACGVPVIAYGKGGALETIKGIFPNKQDFKSETTGVFFEQQTTESLNQAVDYFEKNEKLFKPVEIRKNAERFSKQRFEEEFRTTIETLHNNWKNNR
ncbi:glycosyltransferase involved in cell wall biosynthesis [Mangrovibacterium marinum]|uniref:Glycosyltransferase involved in cell wall biosynthesis n=1 Tax=Mangrovibacterium marinum TaxID=1639118 RepID=A0A2T5BTS9_9BACT|nr:glycosyltransferase family 4 protein [Mangrovibacterium marinum]PTN02879.1 glycosyltransferase involved in cell wall biosynthesis [Mangrovibacterium marinum]